MKITTNNWQDSRLFGFLMELMILIVIFLVPTIFDRRLGIVFSGTKTAWMRLFGIIILSLWSLKIIISKKHFFFRSILDWPVVTYLLGTTIATLTSVHVYTSFAGFYGRYEGLTSWYLFALFFFTVTNYVYNLDQVKRIIITLASSTTLMAVYSVIQRHGVDPYMWGGVVTWQRVIGTIGQPNFLAAYMLLTFFMILPLFMMPKHDHKTSIPEQLQIVAYFVAAQLLFLIMIYNLEAHQVFVWYFMFGLITFCSLLFTFNYHKLSPIIINVILGLGLVLAYVSILYTQSRGGYMGLFTGGVLFTLAAGRQMLFDNRRKIFILGSIIVLISGITMIDPQFSPFERFTAEVTTDKSDVAQTDDDEIDDSKLELKGAAGSRGESWKSAFNILVDYPIFGVGPEVLKMVFPRYETDLFRFKEAFHVKQDRCHNETFDVAVTKGLVTLFVFLWLLYTFFKTGWLKTRQLDKPEALIVAGLIAAALAFLIQNQFSFGVVAITSLFWVNWALVMVIGNYPSQEEPSPFNWQEFPWLAIAGVLVVAAILTYVSFLSFYGDIYFKSGKTKEQIRRLDLSIQDYEKSLKVYPYEGGTVSHLGIAYLNSSQFKDPIQLQKAIETLEYGIKIDPYNADNFFILARIYLIRNDLVKAEELARIAIKIDPYYAEVFQLLGAVYESQGKLAEAADNYERTFFINPNLIDPMNRLAAVNVKLGRPAETLAVFERALKKYSDNVVVQEVVARAYLNKGLAPQALKIANRMLRHQEKPVVGYIIKAKALKGLGRADEAYSALQDALMRDPRNTEAREFLGQLK
ncbi:MAG: O-antigen ligase family protein [bacterium]